jgi:hypothetical protein
MPQSEFEEKYMDVLQNIEFGIVSVYRQHAEMVDWDALKAIETLIREYQAELASHPLPAVELKPLAQEVHDSVKSMCEWRLGRGQALKEEKKSVFKLPFKKSPELSIESKTTDEIILCLKRIRKSIERWNRRSGRQGYLDFISEFVK